jgi:DNA-binding response OmpR family regulator
MKTIVIVDDEFSLAEVVAAALSDVGFRVWVAPNGAHGLKVMSEHRPDLVILDCMMPILDGPGVLAAMRADERLDRVPVVMMSSLPEAAIPGGPGHAVRRGGDGYVAFLRKPFDFDDLLGVVGLAIGGARDGFAPTR